MDSTWVKPYQSRRRTQLESADHGDDGARQNLLDINAVKGFEDVLADYWQNANRCAEHVERLKRLKAAIVDMSES